MKKTKTLPMRAGKNLKRLIRLSEYKTQAKFAEAFGADERTVGRWCREGIDSLSRLEELADFLHALVVFDLLS